MIRDLHFNNLNFPSLPSPLHRRPVTGEEQNRTRRGVCHAMLCSTQMSCYVLLCPVISYPALELKLALLHICGWIAVRCVTPSPHMPSQMTILLSFICPLLLFTSSFLSLHRCTQKHSLPLPLAGPQVQRKPRRKQQGMRLKNSTIRYLLTASAFACATHCILNHTALHCTACEHCNST